MSLCILLETLTHALPLHLFLIACHRCHRKMMELPLRPEFARYPCSRRHVTLGLVLSDALGPCGNVVVLLSPTSISAYFPTSVERRLRMVRHQLGRITAEEKNDNQTRKVTARASCAAKRKDGTLPSPKVCPIPQLFVATTIPEIGSLCEPRHEALYTRSIGCVLINPFICLYTHKKISVIFSSTFRPDTIVLLISL